MPRVPSVKTTVPAVSSGRRVGAPSLYSGDRIGPYTLGRRLGRGGGGETFQATRRVGTQEMEVALKVSPLRYEREAKRLNDEGRYSTFLTYHGAQNIVKVNDFGVVDGYAYLEMELIRGASLRDLLEDANENKILFTSQFALTITREICLGLRSAYNLGVQNNRTCHHMDVKPDNVLITRDGQVKISDFSIAAMRFVGSKFARGIYGTALYMSPEACAMEVEKLDELSDIYSLGVTLFEMLEGSPPFTGNYQQLFRMHREEPFPCGTRGPELQRLIDCMVARDRDRRVHNYDLLIHIIDLTLEELGLTLFPLEHIFSSPVPG
ncbi:MAG: serine/threonine protein kinase [Candidatus Margulisbacteria bacterium]|nr:serine/threonine protein kinase [Candidatus Margulisiibacteriota bacterium]MBU1022171.1 serine/threonine protein kinase [Candidatus Margulisiibacteriota bacterium]MBU1729390.1 serine/threonine protein kinase [Candidatus Margulisiibacteriota bacterium]MBU1955663.1 serine/threonine protein kinase [Candidatus Margulisiibacteriota bacterium]